MRRKLGPDVDILITGHTHQNVVTAIREGDYDGSKQREEGDPTLSPSPSCFYHINPVRTELFRFVT